MDEKKIQHEYVMEFLCRLEEQGGLGYRSVSNIVVSNDLFIPSIMGEFVKNSQPDTWVKLMRKFGQDEQALQTALKDKVKDALLDAQNVATFINTHKTITFEGEKVWLFYVSGTELKGDEEFKQNIFCAVEESSHTLKVLYHSSRHHVLCQWHLHWLHGIEIFDQRTDGKDQWTSEGSERLSGDGEGIDRAGET